MKPLQSELDRLYVVQGQAGTPSAAQPPGLIDGTGRVRALVLELTRRPDWDTLSRVWQGVQAELELPAPAIAVDGIDALQLWFALAEPVPAARAHAFLERLRQRYLADVDPKRVRLRPSADVSPLRHASHAALVPALQSTGNWSAFLAPDLVGLFADTPWLDTPPGEEAQASLLRSIHLAKPAEFETAWQKLGPTPPLPAPAEAPPPATQVSPALEQPRNTFTTDDPRQFLLQVMNDNSVALALRIEAAKALLPR